MQTRTVATSASILITAGVVVLLWALSDNGPGGLEISEPALAQSSTDSHADLDGAPSPLPLNKWSAVSSSQALDEVPWLRHLPDVGRLPSGYVWDGTVSVMPWDIDGDGAVDLHRVDITITPAAGARDQSGHGNINIVLAHTPEGPAEPVKADSTLADGTAVAADAGSLVWWEDGVLYQLMGSDTASAAALQAVAESMR